jgi:DNA-binding response OmpR family regulator
VKDNGIGIAESIQGKIFDRFYQVNESHKETGTGIGLSLTKELVSLMGGAISVSSEPGRGTSFSIAMPFVFLPEEKLDGSEEREAAEQSAIEKLPSPVKQLGTIIDESKPHILVVEDNNDLRAYVIESLGDEFHFLEAEQGAQGFELAVSEIPDVIISDVMMPEMDGVEMTTQIRKDIRSSHIPLILLTAKNSEESKLAALKTGADDYLTKPFNKQELLFKVRNSIAIRKKLSDRIRADFMKQVPEERVQSVDDRFLQKIKIYILEKMADEQLGVESLAEHMAMSRNSLYRKVSALTGSSVNELIRKLRLQKASQLLEQNWGPVTQVAFEVGFSSLSYFSKVFKEEFGILPRDYSEIANH